MKGTVQLYGISSKLFDIHCDVRQGCVVVPTPFRIFFTLLVIHAFGTATERIYFQIKGAFLEITETSRAYFGCYSLQYILRRNTFPGILHQFFPWLF